MKYTAALVLASAGWASALTQACSGTATNEGGNWFCGAVNHILYEGIQGKGSFKAVTGMSSTGECNTEDRPYSGPLAPLDEGLSLHFRGPLQLKQVAVYTPGSPKKRDVVSRRAGHSHLHKHLHRANKEKRADIVTATIDGKVVTWENNWFGGAPAAPTPAPAASQPKPDAAPPALNAAKTDNTKSDSGKSNSKGKGKGKHTPSGLDWDRVAYYNAEDGIADNMVFIGNYGGEGSGVFDTVWGNSISYLNANGDGGASSSEILKDVPIPSNKEFAIFSGEQCDESCGFSRAKDCAYKGFRGANKVFMFEFKMPLDGNRGFNGDMPAVWALNEQIPHAAQYNGCSCWKSGCGEVDIYEVLASGDTKCKSTFHLANGAGSSDYFDRPTEKFIKVATVFHEKTASVSIKLLPDDTDFSKGLEDKDVLSWLNGPSDGKLSSLFQLLN